MRNLGFGFLRLPTIGEALDYVQIEKMIDVFLSSGGSWFDTAYTYMDGKCEEAIGKCLSARYPRERFQLTSKLPGYQVTSYEDCYRYFEESARRCGVEWFDVYMLHWLDQKHYALAEKYREFDFLQELKRTGKAKRIGFSFHDTAELLERILTRHPEVDCVLLQVNYLDYDSPAVQSRKCLEVCKKHGKSVIVMEPVKGGTLVKVPETAQRILAQMEYPLSPAAHAIRFARSLPGIEMVLTGVRSVEQMAENLAASQPVSPADLELYRQAAQVIREATAVGCTGCGYCRSGCPMEVNIPGCFAMYNEYSLYPRHLWKIEPAYGELIGGKAGDCIGCGACLERCPQKLEIPRLLKKAAEVFGK